MGGFSEDGAGVTMAVDGGDIIRACWSNKYQQKRLVGYSRTATGRNEMGMIGMTMGIEVLTILMNTGSGVKLTTFIA